MPGIITTTQTITSQIAGAPVPVLPVREAGFYSGGYQQPAILVFVSSGASLTYNIEVTGDDTQIPTYVVANGVWVPFTNMSGLSASAAGTLGAIVKAIRVNVTAYSSGTLIWQFCQLYPGS